LYLPSQSSVFCIYPYLLVYTPLPAAFASASAFVVSYLREPRKQPRPNLASLYPLSPFFSVYLLGPLHCVALGSNTSTLSGESNTTNTNSNWTLFPPYSHTLLNPKMRLLWTLACLYQTCLAFYPYHLPSADGEDTTQSTPRAVQHRRTDNNGSIRMSIRRKPTKRKNNFNIIPAVDPTKSNSLGIAQDGTDFSYFCAFQLGTSQTEYSLLLDSAASNTWIMASDCTTASCSAHNTFGTADSSSLKVWTYNPLLDTQEANTSLIGLGFHLFRRVWHRKCQRRPRH